MSRCTQLVVILSLAACEHVAPATHEPQFVTPPAPAKAEPPKPAEPEPPAPPKPTPPEPEVASEPAIAVPEPAPAPVKKQPSKPFYKEGCAMTRAGCKWKDEKPVKRVTKKPAHEGDLE